MFYIKKKKAKNEQFKTVCIFQLIFRRIKTDRGGQFGFIVEGIFE